MSCDNSSVQIRKVLIVYKKSTFQIQAVEHRESHFIKLLQEKSDSVARVKLAHQEHYDTLEQVKSEFEKRGIEYRAVARVDMNASVDGVDLVVSVGGDGTFLDASHYLKDTPMLGINSSRSSSFGHFCMANISNLASVLDHIGSDAVSPSRLLRLELELNGSVLPELVLNEVLVCHSNPAGTSRYFIEEGGKREEQRSSGIWIGPPAGSTGAIRAAGGKVLPITAGQFQYIVREPCPRPTEQWELLKGILQRDQEIAIVSQMRTGSLFLDGQHIGYNFALGDNLKVRASKSDLIAYVFPDVNDIFQKQE